jgi:hypothetical protein
MRRSWRAAIGIAVAGISVGLASVAAAPARAAVTGPAASAARVSTTYTAKGGLLGVAAASDSSAWAVGYTGQSYGSPKILLLHWNGSSWSKVSFKDSGAAGELAAITVVNSKDAWAVGYTGSPTGTTHSLIVHYNGKTWSPVTSPAPVTGGSLGAVWASTKEVWAAGYYATGPSVPQTFPLSFLLKGTKWSVVRSTREYGVVFDGVTTTTAGITLASAQYTGMITGYLARWNGSSWAFTTSFPEFATYHYLDDIAAGPNGTAFSIGPNAAGDAYHVIAVEWNGHSWVKAPASVPSGSDPGAVAEAPGGTMWSAGQYYAGSYHTLILRWTGREWVRVTSPSADARLDGLGFASAKYGWAVGETTPDQASSSTYILHWNGQSWS